MIKQNIQTKIKKLERYIYVPEIDKEVEIVVHDKDKSFNELKNIYGNNFESMLLTKKECKKILKNKEIRKILKMDGNSSNNNFFIKQYNKKDKKRGCIASIYMNKGWVEFFSYWDAKYPLSNRGVRFVRKKSSGKLKRKENAQ